MLQDAIYLITMLFLNYVFLVFIQSQIPQIQFALLAAIPHSKVESNSTSMEYGPRYVHEIGTRPMEMSRVIRWDLDPPLILKRCLMAMEMDLWLSAMSNVEEQNRV